jgi:hypothetical protein
VQLNPYQKNVSIFVELVAAKCKENAIIISLFDTSTFPY